MAIVGLENKCFEFIKNDDCKIKGWETTKSQNLQQFWFIRHNTIYLTIVYVVIFVCQLQQNLSDDKYQFRVREQQQRSLKLGTNPTDHSKDE